jgi:hypothetical protein
MLSEIATTADPDERIAGAMQDESWHPDCGKDAAQIALEPGRDKGAGRGPMDRWGVERKRTLLEREAKS